MKIGYDVRSLQTGSPPWGIGVYIKNVLQHLLRIDDGNEYFLLSFAQRDFDVELKAPDTRAHHVRLRRIPGYLNLFRDKLNLRSEIGRLDLDIIHFTNPLQLCTCFDLGDLNSRVVITIYDLIPLHFSREIFTGKRKPLSYLYRMQLDSVRRMPHIITISSCTKSDLEKELHIPGERISVIYPGVGEEFETFQSAGADLIEKYDLPSRYLFYVGNFFPYKNLDNLFKALQILYHTGRIDVPIVIGGKVHPFFRERLARTIRDLSISGKVIFLGYVPDELLPILYHRAEAFVYPSLYEGFGIPVLEAMAAGAVVVCSQASSLPEVVGDSALLFDPLSPEDIAEKLFIALDDEGIREELKDKGIQRAGTFSWESAARKTMQFYEKVYETTHGA